MQKHTAILMTPEELEAFIDERVTSALEANRQQGSGPALLTVEEAAELLRCSVSLIRKLARGGVLTRLYIQRNLVRYDRDQVLSVAREGVYYKSKSVKNGY